MDTIRRLVLFLALLALLSSLCACGKHGQDKRAIAAEWESYRAAAEAGDGAVAAAGLSQNTLDHYAKLCKLAMDAPAAECWKLKPTEMDEVLGMRIHYMRKDLKGMSGAQFVARTIKDGHWATYDGDWKLRDIRVNEAGSAATATICNPKAESEYRNQKIARGLAGVSRRTRGFARTMGDAQAPPTFPAAFVKENGDWKYDETATLVELDNWVTAAAKEERMSVRDYLTLLNTEEDDLKKALKIWEPMPK